MLLRINVPIEADILLLTNIWKTCWAAIFNCVWLNNWTAGRRRYKKAPWSLERLNEHKPACRLIVLLLLLLLWRLLLCVCAPSLQHLSIMFSFISRRLLLAGPPSPSSSPRLFLFLFSLSLALLLFCCQAHEFQFWQSQFSSVIEVRRGCLQVFPNLNNSEVVTSVTPTNRLPAEDCSEM